MKKGKGSTTKFIATVAEAQKNRVVRIARDLEKDGLSIDHVSTLFGLITGHSCMSLSELQTKYKDWGIHFEPDREVGI